MRSLLLQLIACYSSICRGKYLATAFATGTRNTQRNRRSFTQPSSCPLAQEVQEHFPTSKSNRPQLSIDNRRKALLTLVTGSAALFSLSASVHAYTPDADPLRESLYLICRIQEATCLQERYIEKSKPPLAKMKLTLRLVDRSYRLLDQINYISQYFENDNVIPATQLGNEAADALQEAIEFVNKQQQEKKISMTAEQRDTLKQLLTETREKLFDMLDYLPDQTKLAQARNRVEEENKLNQNEFDPDLANDAGVYNPVVMPWKTARTPSL